MQRIGAWVSHFLNAAVRIGLAGGNTVRGRRIVYSRDDEIERC
jgi:hypothetical protein